MERLKCQEKGNKMPNVHLLEQKLAVIPGNIFGQNTALNAASTGLLKSSR